MAMKEEGLGDFLCIYERFAVAENKSPRTIESVKSAVRKFDRFLGGCSNPKDVRSEDLRDYIIHLQACPRWSKHPTIKPDHGNLSHGAIASYVRSIRSFWSWMQSEKFIDYNPLDQVAYFGAN